MSASVTGLLLDAAYLMVMGMLVVYLFLGCLIGAMACVAWLIKKFPEPELQHSVQRQPAASSTPLSGSLLAAITAAIHQHRHK